MEARLSYEPGMDELVFGERDHLGSVSSSNKAFTDCDNKGEGCGERSKLKQEGGGVPKQGIVGGKVSHDPHAVVTNERETPLAPRQVSVALVA